MYTAEGTLVNWLRPDGARVKQGEPVLEIETEKAIQPVAAPTDGILHHTARVGSQLREEAIIGYVLAEGERPPGAGNETSQHSPRESGAKVQASHKAERWVSFPARQSSTSDMPGRVKASPLARRLAAEQGFVLQRIEGSGPGGRIVEADILAEAKRGEAAGATRMHLAGRAPLWRQDAFHSVQHVLPLTITREVDADKLVAARRKLAEEVRAESSFDGFFIKLLAAALRECPQLNAVVGNEETLILEQVNIGFAVAAAGGSVTPVIREADQVSVAEISQQVRALVGKARAGEMKAADVSGGTATIINLSAHGIDAFTPPLYPPQSCSLGIGRIQQRPTFRDGTLAVAPIRVLSLTFDPRVADVVSAAELLDNIARRMNDEGYLASLI